MGVKQPNVEQIFDAAIHQKAPGERAMYLDGACRHDARLRARVEALLKAHDAAGSFLDPPLVDSDTTVDSPVLTEGPGTTIGRYKLLQRIGEGGFGVVYMAEQQEPVRRKVALKIIKLGMDTKQVIARFEAERQALAMMEHPNIAKVLDAGATDTGRPFFVMELVKGIPITEYCDQNKLGTQERLRLFVAVCAAVQHAHQKGIIHRDIKPKNVLVTLHDGEPVPKVIDFGIAKATSHRLTEMTLFTGFRQLIGTPAYMSPEQAEMSGLDVDTRTDIYSLGVLLYELLTGTTPFDANTLRDAAYDEIQRIIREVEPPKPSTRVETLEDKLTDIAKHRRAEPDVLRRCLRGDLDWIVMKALEKDRTRRYETPNELANDIRRHLHCQPVLAGPPSVPYKLHKFVRRHRVGVMAASIVAAALLAGSSLATVGLIQATNAKGALQQERDQAEKARDEAEKARRGEQEHRQLAEAAAEKARSEADKCVAIADFLEEMLASVDPAKAQGREVTVRYVLDEAAGKIEEGLLDEEPEVEASVRMTIGKTYQSLGLYGAAEGHLKAAEAIRRNLLGKEAPDTLQSRAALAGLLRRRGKNAEAEVLFRQVVDAQRRVLGEEHPDTLTSMTGLGIALWRQTKNAEAEEVLSRAHEIQRRVLGEEDLETLRSAINLATAQLGQGKLAEAEQRFRRELETARRVLGDGHPVSMAALNNLALALEMQGKLAEAEVLYRETLERDVRVLGPEHPNIRTPLYNLKRVLRARGKRDELRRLFAEQIALQKRAAERPGADALALNSLAWLLLTCEVADLRDPETALPIAERAVELDGGNDANILDTLALAYRMTGDLDRALETQRKAVARARSVGQGNLLVLEDGLIGVLAERRKLVQAARVYCRSLPRRVAESLSPKPFCCDTLMSKAWVLAERGQFAEAQPLMLKAYETVMADEDAKAIERRRVLERMIEFYEAWGKPDRAERWRRLVCDATQDDQPAK